MAQADQVSVENADKDEKQMEDYSKAAEHYEKQIYDLQQMLEITRSLCSTIELNKLIESILYATMAQMRALGAGVFILSVDDSTRFYLGANYSGFELDASIDYTIPTNAKLVEYISSSQNKVYTTKDLREALSEDSHHELEILESLHPTLIVPLILKNHLNGILILGERISTTSDDCDYDDYEKQEICTIASLAAIAVNNASLVEQSSTDMMTRLKLKYYFFNVLTDKLDSASFEGSNVCVMMFDIDFFKKFNDTYGHACGDYVLQEVAKLIKSSIRNNDLASRYGGEEFTVMLDRTTTENAMTVAERIRRNIEKHDFYYQDEHMKVTISVGVALYDKENNPVTSPKILVDQADQALYVSKRNGRNQVTLATKELLDSLAQMD